MAHLVGQHLGNYHLKQLLGEGGFAQVYLGEHTYLGTLAAIKVLHTRLTNDDLEKFQTEARLVARLIHPHIVRVLEFGIEDKEPYLVMDYAPNGTLRQRHPKGVPLSLTTVVSYVKQIAAAVEYAHGKNLIHRDIKPANMLVGQNNEILLSDFGIAVVSHSELSLTTQEMAGTIFYIAPEQIQRKPQKASDQYALGVVVYEWLSGVCPFQGSLVEVIYQHLSLPPPSLQEKAPTIPLAIEQVVLKALAKDPKDRFESVEMFALALEQACSMQQQLLQSMTLMKYPALQKNAPLENRANSPHVAPPANPSLKNSIPEVLFAQISLPSHLISPVEEVILFPDSVNRVTKVSPPNHLLSTPTLPGKTSRKWPQFLRRRVPTVVIALLLLSLATSSIIGITLLFSSNSNKEQPVTSSILGHVFFQDDALGHEDQLRLEMLNVTPPPNGSSYFAWLKTTNQQSLPLGQLTLKNGNISFLYPGDNQHTNLLSIAQGVFLTQETTDSHLHTPANKTVYQALFTTATFQYIKNILYQTPNFPDTRGVISGLLETIKSMNDKAGSVVDTMQGNHDYDLSRRESVRIIEMVDGTSYAQSSNDLPANDPPLLHVQLGLLSSPTQQGYIDTLATQIDQLKQTAANNSSLLQHIQNIQNAVNDLRDWVQKIRSYAVQILKAVDLHDPAIISVALQLRQTAADSYTGHVITRGQDPQSTVGSAGAIQAYIEAQYLATLDVKQV